MSEGRSRVILAAGRVVLSLGILTGCSSVPDAVNPVEWYKGAENLIAGRDRPETASPGTPKGEFPDVNKDARKEPAKALVADRGNAKYAEPVRREVAPTKPLAKRATPPADTQVAAQQAKPAAAPVVPPAPAVAKSDLPPAPTAAPAQVAQTRLSPDRPQQPARDEGPNSPPQALSMTPPAPAAIPETVPTPGQQRMKPVQAQYQKRLAESAATVVRPDIVDTGASAAALRTVAGLDDEPIHLVPPSSKRGGRAKGVAERDVQAGPAASFQVASLEFQATSATLTKEDRAAIAEVARLYRQSRGGVVRIVGQAPAPVFAGDEVSRLMGGLDASMQRANTVAKELTRRGVPAGKILVGGDPNQGDGSGAKVYLDVI